MPEIRLTDKQLQFFEAAEREVLYAGAFGAGKSYTLGVKLAHRASVRGAREGLYRYYYSDLRDSTLKVLLEGDGATPPILAPDTYSHNKSDHEITLLDRNKRPLGSIVYRGLEDMQKVAGQSLTGAAVDEAIELDEQQWAMLRGRLRVQIPGLPCQLYAATNPSTPEHFLAKRFGIAVDRVDPTKAEPNTRAILTTTFDNPFIPKEYVDDLKTFTGVRYRRYVLGQWIGQEGLVYDDWSRDRHRRKLDTSWTRSIVAIDDGSRDPLVALLMHRHRGGIHVAREFYQTDLRTNQKCEAIAKLAKDTDCIIYDDSARQLGIDLRDFGLPARKADKGRITEGISKIQQRLSDGSLTVDPSCEKLITELESYEWRPGKDEPVDANNHACDALRYGVCYLDKGAPFVGGWVQGATPRIEEVGSDAQKELNKSLSDYYAQRQADPFGSFRPQSTRRNYRV